MDARRIYEIVVTLNVRVVEVNAESAEEEFTDINNWEVLFLGENSAWSTVESVEVGDWVPEKVERP